MINKDEMFDVVDENNELTGECETRENVHIKGLWHRAVHVWIYKDNGEILLQQRSKLKGEDDGMWDISVAGHLGAGDEPREAALREVQEEIGVDLDDSRLEDAGVLKTEWPVKGMPVDHRQFLHIYFYKLEEEVEFKFTDGEVSDLKWMPVGEYRAAVDSEETKHMYKQHNRDYRDHVDAAFRARQ